MPAELIRWTGGPGAGKTWALLEDVRRELTGGRTLRDMCLMTFSRSQAADLAARLRATVLPDEAPTAILSRCATIDAIALRACRAAGLIDNPKTQVIQPGDRHAAAVYAAFMEAHGLPYDPAIGGLDGEDPARALLPIGNQLVMIGGFLQATLQPPEAWRQAAGAMGLETPGHTWPIPDLLRAWTAHKEQKGVFEHADYVALALREQLPPPAPVLFVDEYQDVSPLHDALIRQWTAHPDTARVYVAGDPDQSIYGFRGCRPDLFVSLKAADRGARDDGTRPVSHRCPVRIMQTAETILGHPANVTPCTRNGMVARTRPGDTEGLIRQIEEAVRAYPGRPVFILSRFKKHTRGLARAVSSAGIPCSGIRDPWINRWGTVKLGRTRDSLEAATVNLWTLTKGIRRYARGMEIDPIPLDEATALVTATLPPKRREHALVDLRTKAKNTLRLGDVFRWTGPAPGGPGIFDVLNLLPRTREQIHACVARETRRGTVIAPETVKIDTIHSAKGLETAVVLMHTRYLEGMAPTLTDPARVAEERRVYFVGATRAEAVLILFDYGFPTCPILAGVGT